MTQLVPSGINKVCLSIYYSWVTVSDVSRWLKLCLLPARSQSRTSLNLKRIIRALTRNGRIWSSFICSTKEIWTPSLPQLCAAPRKMSHGCAASSKLPSKVEKSKPSQHLLRRVKRRREHVGRGWELGGGKSSQNIVFWFSPVHTLTAVGSCLSNLITHVPPGWQRATRSRANAKRDGARQWRR